MYIRIYLTYVRTYANMSPMYNSPEQSTHMAHYTCVTHCRLQAGRTVWHCVKLRTSEIVHLWLAHFWLMQNKMLQDWKEMHAFCIYMTNYLPIIIYDIFTFPPFSYSWNDSSCPTRAHTWAVSYCNNHWCVCGRDSLWCSGHTASGRNSDGSN